MATGNFMYDNRCVFVSDDDYEFNNHPKTENSKHDTNRSYSRRKLADYDYIFFEIVLTAGYYEGGCIDYIQTEEPDNYEYLGFDTEQDAHDAMVKEELEVNKVIDKIKTDYGYPEYAIAARFSNGEAWYTEVAT